MSNHIDIIDGIYALLNHLNVVNTSKGVEKSVYDDRHFKGRLAHFNVSQKQELAENIISAIIKLGNNHEDERKRRPSYLLLRKRKKRFASRGE